MGKREKNLKASKSRDEEEDEENEDLPTKSVVLVSSSSDDEEANEDLSLKIVQKAMLRACSAPQRSNESNSVGDAVINLSSSPDVKIEKKIRKEKKQKKNKKETAVVGKEEGKAETSNVTEINENAQSNPVEISDNVVLRKLLRGPRYFDPPDSGWGTCYNCGEEGHTAVNCASAKRKKPCFVCGSLEHNAKQCKKGQDCYICKKGGHRAKDCPEKYKGGSHTSKICLKCGDPGHDMFSCKNGYAPDDLKEIQCYICKSFGHLCCADFTDTSPRELSCYRCGQLGHSGLECRKSHGEPTNVGPLGSCFKCGEEGHFARQCESSTKVRKKLQMSTPTQKFSENKRDHVRTRSVPFDLGSTRKRKNAQYEEEFTTPPNSKWRGGWITEDPGDLSCGKAKVRGWGSSVTPTNNRNKAYVPLTSGHASSSRSSRKDSNGSSKFYQHRYSASRFGNFSNDGMRRNYYW
ncbi:uncharacterized protein LOC130795519 [Actinidia eriantha]|uniref:uncharacterized protein LOC130795519 n=1 Tax=Actinidia eriantha TaxID=165200 RepID=UPI00258A6EB2|nr:uncharacterized protein LOC130795519 [Actinidia eriantha]